MSTIESLNNISHQINIYVGTTMFIFGVIGCLWNLLIFRHYTLRLSSCCIYMFVGSATSLILIIFGLLIRILSYGFDIDWGATNLPWCKICKYITFCASFIALSCLVWATIDRFFSTCRQIKWRSFNSVHRAKEICFITIVLWLVVGIPIIIHTVTIQPEQICVITSSVWSTITTYFFHILCYGIFPWLLMAVFAILTLKNIRRNQAQRINPLALTVQTRTARIDNQLLWMLFFQVMVSVISSIPYCVENIYNSLTQSQIKNPYREAQEDLFYQVVHLAFYLNYTSMFYVNYLSSSIFRNLSKKVLINLFKNKDNISREITIINHQVNDIGIERKQLNISTIEVPYRITNV